MKKLAFTLSEVLIALGVIGVVSAITVPMIGDIIPDKDKMKVLKCYKTIVDINNELLNDPSLYWTPTTITCAGLGCTQRPIVEPYSQFNSYEGPQKFPSLFFEKLERNKENCQTTDGTWWTMSVENYANDNFHFIITVDLNGSEEGPNASYSSEQKKPDRFTFKVAENGAVSGNDALTKAYLKNPHNLNDKKKDYEVAAEGG